MLNSPTWNWLIEQANAAGSRWAVWMTAALFDSVLLLIVFGFVWQLLRKRATPQFGSWLFLLIAARLLSPIEIRLPAPLARWAPATVVESWIWKNADAVGNANLPAAQPDSATRRSARDLEPVPRTFTAEPPSLESNQAPRATLATPIGWDVSIEEPSAVLRAPAVAMGIWSIVVVFLVVRFARTQWRFRRCVAAARPIDQGQFPVDLAELCRRAGVNRRIRFVASDHVAIPAVWGILRPTVIVPPGLASSLDVPHLQWVLLHELAHVRRFDLLFILLENLAAMLHFFNPAIWIANRMANRLREYACDDFALAVSGRSGIDAGEAFVRVLRHASQSRHVWDGAIGIFGLDAQASCLDRVRRLVDSRQPPAAGASRAAWIGLIVLSLTAVPCLRGASAEEKTDRATALTGQLGSSNAAAAKSDGGKQADEKVVGTVVSADGRPLAGVEVLAVRANGRRETPFVTDQKGEIRLPLSWWREPRYGGDLVNLVAKDADRIGWHQIESTSARVPRLQGPLPPPKPFQITLLPLDRTVTGHLVDPNGKPLARVRIQTFQLRNPANGFAWFSGFGMQDELPMPNAVTDEKGKFHMKMPKQVFAQLDALDPAWVVRHLHLDHADHDLGEVEMVPAGRISGNVVLPDGKPAIGFRLYAGRFNAVRSRSFPPPAKPAKNGKDDPQLGNAGYAVTDAAGKFEIGGLYPEPHEVHVEVDPQRPSLLANSANSIAIRAGQTETTNFKLQTARHVVGRAFEIGSNRPITRVDIYSSVSPNPKRREFSQGGGSGLTNEQGEFEFYTLPGLSRILVNQADPDGKAILGATQEVEIAADRDPAPVVFRLEPPKPGLFRPRFMKRMVVARANRLDRIVAFAFDSKWERVVTVASPAQGPLEGNQDVRVRRVADDKNLVQFETPETFLTDVAFSPDGETIITAGGLNNARRSAGELKIWDAESGELLHTLTGHTKMVLSVACSPDGKLIASGGFDRTVRIWNAETGVQTALFKGDSAARSLTFSRDGKTLVAGLGWSGAVKFWDAATFRELRTLKAKNLYLFSVALSPDGKRLAAAGVERDPDSDRAYPDRGRVHIWDLESGKSLPPIPLPNQASGVVFSADGKYVLVASHIGEIFSAETGKEVGVIRRGSISGGEDKIRISLDGTRMAIGSPIDLSLWDLSGLGQPTK